MKLFITRQNFNKTYKRFLTINNFPKKCETNVRDPIKTFKREASNQSIRDKFLTNLAAPSKATLNKVTIVGAGNVGLACAFGLLNQGITKYIALVDKSKDKSLGEVLDMKHGLEFLGDAQLLGGSDFAITKDSIVCVVTAGAHTKEGQSRLDLLQANIGITKDVVEELIKHSPGAILILVSNPVDILSYYTWKITGLPKEKIVGAGCNLDSSRFHYYISKIFGIGPASCHGFVIGEHGDSSVPVWSGVNIGGVKLHEAKLSDADLKYLHEIHKKVVTSSYEVIKRKGFTSWAIGLSVCDLVDTILKNKKHLHSISVHVKGLYGIKEDVWLSLPAVLGEQGVSNILIQNLSDEEIKGLHKSAKILEGYQKKLKI